MMLISNPKQEQEQVPAGLTSIKPELALMGGKFITLVNYNKSVYGPFYADIIMKVMFSGSPPAANSPQSTAQDAIASD